MEIESEWSKHVGLLCSQVSHFVFSLSWPDNSFRFRSSAVVNLKNHRHSIDFFSRAYCLRVSWILLMDCLLWTTGTARNDVQPCLDAAPVWFYVTEKHSSKLFTWSTSTCATKYFFSIETSLHFSHTEIYILCYLVLRSISKGVIRLQVLRLCHLTQTAIGMSRVVPTLLMERIASASFSRLVSWCLS